DRSGVALDDEGVAAAHRLLVANIDLAVGEVVGAGRDELGPELGGDLLRQCRVCAPCEDHEVLLGALLDPVVAPILVLAHGMSLAHWVSLLTACRLPRQRRQHRWVGWVPGRPR